MKIVELLLKIVFTFLFDLFKAVWNIVANYQSTPKDSVRSTPPDIDRWNAQVMLIQAFESAEIINSTVNHDIIRSRIIFLKDRLQQLDSYLKPLSTKKEFIISKAVDKYKTDYYDLSFHDFQLHLVTGDMAYRENFYTERIFASYQRFTEKQAYEIALLKTRRGQINREHKVKEQSKLFESILDELGNKSEKYNSYKQQFTDYKIPRLY